MKTIFISPLLCSSNRHILSLYKIKREKRDVDTNVRKMLVYSSIKQMYISLKMYK